ncbi:hypothetical protein SI65_02032 [Aspergillus cristatus]|uniref:Uncharacterized protein n=1 Tax=Aspergillus cristatus TaxID=573508 RepID=A0A1E3BTH9_ASPCR|nr:hypothetical protein SI65_01849 [Aspergillus cristatus]ODM24442.1 hypothetical protein SI65_02032 [Aspergillus cristatus]
MSAHDNVVPYPGLSDLIDIPHKNCKNLRTCNEDTAQYISFQNVTSEEFQKIETSNALAKFRYNAKTQELITNLEGVSRGWIESRGGLVNMVITMSVGLLREPWTMTIETWEPYPPRTDYENDDENEKKKVAPIAARTCVLIIETQNNTVDGGIINPETGNVISPCDELCIPFEAIYRRAPVGRETDIVFDRDALLELASMYWQDVRNDWKRCPN